VIADIVASRTMVCDAKNCNIITIVVYLFQLVDQSVVVHNLRSLDGGILDPDDRIQDVVDDREQVRLRRSRLDSPLHIISNSASKHDIIIYSRPLSILVYGSF